MLKNKSRTRTNVRARSILLVAILLGISIGMFVATENSADLLSWITGGPQIKFLPRGAVDTSGYLLVGQSATPWKPAATPEEIGKGWDGAGRRAIAQIDQILNDATDLPLTDRVAHLSKKALFLNSEGEPKKAYQTLEQIRLLLKTDQELSRDTLYSVIFYQGVTALRRGENENCIMCRGESSCIIPIASNAIHLNTDGSRLAIRHFTEYLKKFPDDIEVRWLLNVAHMTLGEHPNKVDPQYLIALDNFYKATDGIGKFRDIGHVVGVNQFMQAGGAIMDDFDNDGLLDIVITSIDATCQMNLLHNTGKGTFEDTTTEAGLIGQLGGMNCVQTDYNNDGLMDIFVIRGAWVWASMRPSLLRQEKDGKFTDVTEEAGLLDPVNSIAASWADYDNDGLLDLFVCCERQANLLYHNLGNGTFKEVAYEAGLNLVIGSCKGCAWIDFDNDGYPDLFLNYYSKQPAQLFHNNRDGTFTDVTELQGIDGPVAGFSCWAWDYDNDGWLDIFATCYDKSLGDVVKGLIGQPHGLHSNRLFRNLGGKGFKDVTKEVGLDLVFCTMGSNFGDFDNDGFLDMYLGTGDPDFSTLIPNRMMRNLAGNRFVDITASTGTGNLQKGHGVACGDWDCDGNVDLFIKMGGVVNGDKYHNILFQNPGHKNKWLTVKLIGKETNRAAIGARIKIVTDGKMPQTFYRHVSSGSSFGANPLQQTIGLANADRIAVLEIDWPTSKRKQVFRNIAVDQAITIIEFSDDYQIMDWKPIPIPTTTDEPQKMSLNK